MANVNQVYRSNYPKWQDLKDGSEVLTVQEGWEEVIENAEDDPKSKKQKRILVRTEEYPDLPLILNSTNANDLVEIFGSDDTDKWTGKKFLAYADKSVKFGGKKVGGLRRCSTESNG